MKVSDFLKTYSFIIIFTFIDDYTLNSDKKFEVLNFAGLCGLGWFLKQKLAFADKN